MQHQLDQALISAAEIKQIAHHGPVEQRAEVAAMENVRPELLFYLAQDTEPGVRREVANNNTTPLHAFEMLVMDDDIQVRVNSARQVARHAAEQPDIEDPTWRIIEGLLFKLVEDLSEQVRLTTAKATRDIQHMPTEIVMIQQHDPIASQVIDVPPIINESPHKAGLGFRMINQLTRVVSGSILKRIFTSETLTQEQQAEIYQHVTEGLEEGDIEGDVRQTLDNTICEEFRETAPGRAQALFLQGDLTEEALLQAMADKDLELLTAGWALLAELPHRIIKKVINLRHTKGIMSLTWKAGLSPKFGQEVQVQILKLQSRNVLYPRGGTDFPMTKVEMNSQIDRLLEIL